MSELNPIKVKAFLKDLTALSTRHHIAIGGCGCCGSPYLFFQDDPCKYVAEKDEYKLYKNLTFEVIEETSSQ